MTPIIIPAYEPDERMLHLLNTMEEKGIGPVVIVDDGSGPEYADLFAQAQEYVRRLGGTILTHEVNRGKGRALKTAFAHILEAYPDAAGGVTADSDGQHTADCILSVRQALEDHPDNLILGVRRFDEEGVPWRSRAGNKITEKVFSYVSGVHVTDTQTGLRGIPRAFMKDLLDVPGERFEFETHFNTFSDSVKIYRILAKKYLKYVFASVSSCVIDLALFAVFCFFLKERVPAYITVSTVLARVISAVYNYIITYKVVFASKQKVTVSGMKFFLLAVVQMSLSALLVTAGCALLPFLPEVAVKAFVDCVLFFISYTVQQKYIF